MFVFVNVRCIGQRHNGIFDGRVNGHYVDPKHIEDIV